MVVSYSHLAPHTWHLCIVWQHSDNFYFFGGRQLFWFILIQKTFSSFLTLNNITIKLFYSSTIPRQQELLSVRDFYQIEVSFFWLSSAIDKIKLMQSSFFVAAIKWKEKMSLWV